MKSYGFQCTMDANICSLSSCTRLICYQSSYCLTSIAISSKNKKINKQLVTWLCNLAISITASQVSVTTFTLDDLF